jgi:hypothetical protein
VSDEQAVVGTLSGITEKPSGWFEIEVSMPGKQYPLKLSTKKQELVELARAAGENAMTWRYAEQESEKINEHTGKPYVNRYFNGVVPMSQQEPAPAGSEPTHHAGTKPDVDWDAKERRDYRSRAWAQTIAAFNHTIKTDETPAAVFARLKPFQKAVYLDIVKALHSPQEEDFDIPF